MSETIEINKGGWGNHCSLFSNNKDWREGRVYGHTMPLPKPGQQVSLDMRSGRCHTGRLTRLKYCGDPEDMWFATVRWDDWIVRLSINWPYIGAWLYKRYRNGTT